MIIERLSWDACVAVLSANHTAALSCSRENQPYTVPITYAFSGNCFYSFSAMGQKLEWMRENKLVCLSVTQSDQKGEWTTIVANGAFEELTDDPYFDNDKDYAWKVLSKRSNWWEPGSLKPTDAIEHQSAGYVYYRVQADTLTGRKAAIG